MQQIGVCTQCAHACHIPEGGYGRCRMYTLRDGILSERFPDRYLAVWPGSIETIPFLHVTPGARYLLLSTVGCNLSCNGCVSHILAKNPEILADALQYIPPEDIVRRIRDESCSGALFCLNEPTVSRETLLRVAERVRSAGLLMGVASNGCFSRSFGEELLTHIDGINIGLKGASDEAYAACNSPCGVFEIFNTIRRIAHSPVHLEISIVYRKGREDEVYRAAVWISQISPDIPFHIMRFVPFEGAPVSEEPSGEEAELMLLRCRTVLRYVYLFNTPGVSRLSTICPVCGEMLIERSFYGPMGARLTGRVIKSVCTCGHVVPIRGEPSLGESREPRYRGGYRTSIYLDMIASTLSLVGVRDEASISRALVSSLSGSYPEVFQKQLATPEGYLQYLRQIGDWSGADITDLIYYLEEELQKVRDTLRYAERPRLLCTMATPLLPSFPDKMEVALAAEAGAIVLNTTMRYSEEKTCPFTIGEFNQLSPEVILISGRVRIQDYAEQCRNAGIDVEALRIGKVYRIPDEYPLSGPFWILTLKYLGGLLHPDLCRYDMEAEKRGLLQHLQREKSIGSVIFRGSM